MDTLILVLYIVAAALPLLALVLSLAEFKKQTTEHEGYGLNDFRVSKKGVRAEFIAKQRDIWLVGGGVVIASVAGVLSILPIG
ncbi:hypothetical protein [Plantibacter sp. VKM Ac-2876]|uniref:hypothetical protein n=1 Tax=Plantibacter sp. VKM Ac-2876 TaxID=2783826 RepID=UPI00188D7A06|nr:hypothetical protein [Plantibacter sp. VKM Ac-2876]MBF4565408.1 hypothetical protein [Plantibacter sp. VKM Ac-2876]